MKRMHWGSGLTSVGGAALFFSMPLSMTKQELFLGLQARPAGKGSHKKMGLCNGTVALQQHPPQF